MPSIIPAAWKPAATMRRIHIHWTAGGHKANATDKSHYHIIVESDGKLVRGNTPIDANQAGSGKKQASHTLNANTGAIGVSMCCMQGAEEKPFKAGPSPMTKVQWEKMIKVAAELAKHYGIPVTPTTILTHAEVEPNLHIKQRNKWDVTRLAFDDSIVGHKAVGDKMRLAIAVELDGLAGGTPGPLPPDLAVHKFKVTGVAPSSLNLRRSPNGEKVGELAENTAVERISGLGDWSQVRVPGGFVGWVSTAFLRPV